jgi:hypothetical protein
MPSDATRPETERMPYDEFDKSLSEEIDDIQKAHAQYTWKVAVYLLAVALIIQVIAQVLDSPTPFILADFLQNLVPEVIGAALTFVLLDWVWSRRSDKSRLMEKRYRIHKALSREINAKEKTIEMYHALLADSSSEAQQEAIKRIFDMRIRSEDALIARLEQELHIAWIEG